MNYNGWGRSDSIKICGGYSCCDWENIRSYQQEKSWGGGILVWTWQFWSHPVTMASVIFIFHFKVTVVVNSCCCLVRILYFYSSYKINFKFWTILRTNGYVERVLVNDIKWINSFTVFTIHRTTRDLYKSIQLLISLEPIDQFLWGVL